MARDELRSIGSIENLLQAIYRALALRPLCDGQQMQVVIAKHDPSSGPE
jgi:hypothetical protein